MKTIETNFQATLQKVEKPSSAHNRYGENEVRRITEEGNQKYVFEDDLVQITWFPAWNMIYTKVQNKSDHSIKIIWDQGAFVGPDGSTCGIAHGDMSRMDLGKPVSPSVIPRNANLTKTIIPECNITSDSIKPILSGFPRNERVPQSDVEAVKAAKHDEAKEYEGQTFRILLPLEIEGVVNDYSFTFQVDRVTVK